MKRYKLFQIGTLAIGLVMGSCLGDLEVDPINPLDITAKDVYANPAAYKQGLAKIYASFTLTGQQGPSGNPDVAGVDEGFSSFIRSLWNLQELTTDEAVWSYCGDSEGTICNLHYHTWRASDGIPTALFARILNVVVLSNEFIRATANNEDPEIQRYNAEARFLRALSYYYGIDLFGKLPFVTEADLPGAFLPTEKSRSEIFDYVVSELKEIKPLLGAPKFEYGRADKAACAMLLAKLYMNAEVYLGTGNDMYTEALTELNEVIAGPYTLAPKYLNNFLADNNTSPEVIFSLNNDGLRSQSYSAVWIMIKGNAGNGGWSGLRTTKALYNKFEEGDPRALFATSGRDIEINDVTQTGEGYGVWKFRNINSNGSIPANDATGFIDTDFPLFRLADAYLMYAEAVERGASGGSEATSVEYINALRNRSGDPAIGNIIAADISLDFILDERARELYWEAHRRQDLIRFDKFTGATYLWPWKGNAKEGASIPEFRKLFPIPASDRATNPNLGQNDGY
jgi:starch-binding outer membrane protein, SusD/RagB family